MRKERREEHVSLELAKELEKMQQAENVEFNLSDFALFLSVMKNKNAHENVLSIVTGEDDLKLKEVKVEEVILNKSGKRAIRLDACAVDIWDRNFATEMQNDTDNDDVRRRSRYYQGLLDTPLLKSGKKTRYKNLPPTIITFITQEDIFGKDLAKYTFTEQCEEVENLHLEDGTKKIFLNMSSKNGDPILVSLLQYMKHTTLENPEIIIKDERIIELDHIVTEVKQTEEWEAVKMSILSVGIEQGMEKGEALGILKGKADSIIMILQNKGILTNDMSQKIRKEQNVDILDKWLLAAASAASAEEFMKAIQ